MPYLCIAKPINNVLFLRHFTDFITPLELFFLVATNKFIHDSWGFRIEHAKSSVYVADFFKKNLFTDKNFMKWEDKLTLKRNIIPRGNKFGIKRNIHQRLLKMTKKASDFSLTSLLPRRQLLILCVSGLGKKPPICLKHVFYRDTPMQLKVIAKALLVANVNGKTDKYNRAIEIDELKRNNDFKLFETNDCKHGQRKKRNNSNSIKITKNLSVCQLILSLYILGL